MSIKSKSTANSTKYYNESCSRLRKLLPPFEISPLEKEPGLIDLFIELDEEINKLAFKEDEKIANDVLSTIRLEQFIVPTHMGSFISRSLLRSYLSIISLIN